MPSLKINLQSGDIYLVRFHPATGQELKKFRPAVIVTHSITQLDPRFCLICPFTTHTQPQNQHELLITNPALDQPSLLLTWYLWTIDTNRLISRLGTLIKKDTALLHRSICQLVSPAVNPK